MCVEHEHNKKQYTHLLLTVWFFVHTIYFYICTQFTNFTTLCCVLCLVYGGTYETWKPPLHFTPKPSSSFNKDVHYRIWIS